MKIKILALILISNIGLAQNNPTELKFDKKYYEAVDKWVAFPKNNTDSTYYYGFIYLDEEAGFTYQLGNTFVINDSNKYIPEEIDSTHSTKYRLDENWRRVAIIPQKRLTELNVPIEPKWLKIYKENSESVSYLKNIGYHYNHVGASNLALKPLLKAYHLEPHFDGLEFELSYAYNALGQFEKAILISEKAIENNSKNFYFYRELGYSYKNLNRITEAEKTYRKGIKISDNDFEKSEMAVNMAMAYFESRNKKKFEEWAKITRKYAKNDSRYAQFIDHFEQNWDKE